MSCPVFDGQSIGRHLHRSMVPPCSVFQRLLSSAAIVENLDVLRDLAQGVIPSAKVPVMHQFAVQGTEKALYDNDGGVQPKHDIGIAGQNGGNGL